MTSLKTFNNKLSVKNKDILFNLLLTPVDFNEHNGYGLVYGTLNKKKKTPKNKPNKKMIFDPIPTDHPGYNLYTPRSNRMYRTPQEITSTQFSTEPESSSIYLRERDSFDSELDRHNNSTQSYHPSDEFYYDSDDDNNNEYTDNDYSDDASTDAYEGEEYTYSQSEKEYDYENSTTRSSSSINIPNINPGTNRLVESPNINLGTNRPNNFQNIDIMDIDYIFIQYNDEKNSNNNEDLDTDEKIRKLLNHLFPLDKNDDSFFSPRVFNPNLVINGIRSGDMDLHVILNIARQFESEGFIDIGDLRQIENNIINYFNNKRGKNNKRGAGQYNGRPRYNPYEIPEHIWRKYRGKFILDELNVPDFLGFLGYYTNRLQNEVARGNRKDKIEKFYWMALVIITYLEGRYHIRNNPNDNNRPWINTVRKLRLMAKMMDHLSWLDDDINF